MYMYIALFRKTLYIYRCSLLSTKEKIYSVKCTTILTEELKN